MIRIDSLKGGEEFGRLKVIDLSHSAKRKDGTAGERVMNCLCDCGKEIKVKTSNLKSGNTNSCGCYQSDQAKASNRNRYDNVEDINDHMAISCECGSVNFNLLKSSGIECASCGAIQAGLAWLNK